MTIPAYIDSRIRRPAPTGSFVVAGSTPVISFGNSQTASVATLGLNPSRVEFIDGGGSELVGPARRLATHSSLGTADLGSAPPDSVARVLADCHSYFQRNPYRRWFNQFSAILIGCGVSYYDGSACHLDLVQWATNPTWAKLQPASIRKGLLADDAAFLAAQLRNERLRLLLVNGMSVMRELRRNIPCELEETEPIVGFTDVNCRIFVGTIFDRIRVVGWSTNLQSSFGVTNELRTELANRVVAVKNWDN